MYVFYSVFCGIFKSTDFLENLWWLFLKVGTLKKSPLWKCSQKLPLLGLIDSFIFNFTKNRLSRGWVSDEFCKSFQSSYPVEDLIAAAFVLMLIKLHLSLYYSQWWYPAFNLLYQENSPSAAFFRFYNFPVTAWLSFSRTTFDGYL